MKVYVIYNGYEPDFSEPMKVFQFESDAIEYCKKDDEFTRYIELELECELKS